MSLVFSKSLWGHVRTAAVFLPTRSTVELSGWVASRPQQQEKAEGSFHEQANVNSRRGHQKDLPPTFSELQPPPPRPISEQGARKTGVGKHIA